MTQEWRGEKGPEIVNLPRGARVTPGQPFVIVVPSAKAFGRKLDEPDEDDE